MSKKKVLKDDAVIGVTDKKWLPTIGGNMFGYIPEYRKHDNKWERIPTTAILGGTGVPYPRWNGGILQTILLYGHAQAKALAWLYKAACAANGDIFIEVRVAEFEVMYDIKTRRTDEPSTES